MNRNERLVGEIADVAVLGASAYVGWWKLVAKVVVGFGLVVIVNAVYAIVSGVTPDSHGYYDGGLVTVLMFVAYGLWVVYLLLSALSRGARNLFER